jgi:hypothetical protein
MYPNFFSLENLASTDVKETKPWEFDAKPFSTADPAAYKTWRKQATTKHCFYSLFAGQAPTIRVSEANEPRELRGLIADYDAKIDDEEVEACLVRSDKFYRPTLVHRTPCSGGIRLIWLFDRSLLLPTYEVAKRFLKLAEKRLHANTLLPGFDEGAFLNPTLYYDVGHTWGEAGHSDIPWADACGWLMTVSEKAKWQGDTIPLEVVAEEVEDRFPGRWQGPFTEGARGLRFWDSTADNPTAAVVRPTGMQCFTGQEPFVPWSQIFGRGFVERTTSNRLGSQVDGIWYDGDNYWFQSAEKKWEPNAEREIARHLKVVHGMSAERSEGFTYSEIDKALHWLGQNSRVAGAAPFVYMPTGLIDFMGRKVLNTSNVKTMARADESSEYGVNFPWIGKFLKEFFDPQEQLDFFLAWLQRFYKSASTGKLLQGQAVFIAGEPGRGKTLLTNRIISSLMGGHADAARFLMGETNFNRELFEVGLWAIDDCTPGDNGADHKKFSSLIKKCVANTTFEFHAKFRDSSMIQWSGRIIVTGNLDAESLRILPDIDTSILDKLLLFRAAPRVQHFPDRYEMEDTLRREMPHFAAWLDDWTPPPHVIDEDPRYGIARYHHPDLREAAGESNDAQMVRELLEGYLKEQKKILEGNTTDIFRELNFDDTIKPLLGRYTTRWFSNQLGKLQSKGDGFVQFVRGADGRKVWVIRLGGKVEEPF